MKIEAKTPILFGGVTIPTGCKVEVDDVTGGRLVKIGAAVNMKDGTAKTIGQLESEFAAAEAEESAAAEIEANRESAMRSHSRRHDASER